VTAETDRVDVVFRKRARFRVVRHSLVPVVPDPLVRTPLKLPQKASADWPGKPRKDKYLQM
jgi:hypothetical protein